jgi:outer membrane protein, heavy metal efflux system
MQRLEREVLPKARHWRDDKSRLFAEGKENALAYLSAQRDNIDVVRQYRDILVRHRRSMLRLNTMVGQPILP